MKGSMKEYFCDNQDCRAHILIDKEMADSGILNFIKPQKPRTTPYKDSREAGRVAVNTIKSERILLQHRVCRWWACSLCWDDEKNEYKIERSN